MTYGVFKYISKRIASDKVLADKAFNISEHPNDGYQQGLASMIYKLFDKDSSGANISDGAVASGNKSATECEIIPNRLLVEYMRKLIIRKFEKRKAYLFFQNNICGVCLVDMQLISKFNKVNQFVLCLFDICGKYEWVASLKDKKGITNANAFPKILDEFIHKPNKI